MDQMSRQIASLQADLERTRVSLLTSVRALEDANRFIDRLPHRILQENLTVEEGAALKIRFEHSIEHISGVIYRLGLHVERLQAQANALLAVQANILERGIH